MNTSLARTGLSGESQIEMIGLEGEDIESQQKIYSHAMNVHIHHGQMSDSAMKVCISLFLCRQSFKESSETGWEAFCQANFRKLDMHSTHIRSAIRTGRALWQVLGPESGQTAATGDVVFSQMSRHALTTFSEAPEDMREDLAQRLVELSANTGRAPTGTDVRNEISELRTDLGYAAEAIRLKDEAISRLNETLQVSDVRCSELRETTDRLNRELTRLNSAPRVTVENADPASERVRRDITTATDSLEKTKTALDQALEDLADAQAKRDSLRNEIDSIASSAGSGKGHKSIFSAMQREISGLREKWTAAYLAKVRLELGSESSELSDIAEELHLLALQLKPNAA